MTKRKLGFQDRWMFNRVLCEKDVCRKILRAALGIEAGEISYLNAEQCFEPLTSGRGVRLDVFAKGDGRVYDIEMQVAKERDLGRRMRYYQAAMDVGELGSGEDFAAQSEVADRILSTLTPEEVESLNVLTEKIIHQCKDMGARGERKHGRHYRHGKGRGCRK